MFNNYAWYFVIYFEFIPLEKYLLSVREKKAIEHQNAYSV